MLAKIKTYGIPIALIIFGLSAFFYGAHVERLEANEEIALMEKEYAIRESSALWEAENIRKQQETKYLLEMDRFKLVNAELAADAAGVKYTPGFVHNVIYETYLKDHDAPEDIEYYMCGPGPMSKAVENMLYSLGVPRENLMFDNFGA